MPDKKGQERNEQRRMERDSKSSNKREAWLQKPEPQKIPKNPPKHKK